jgi:hypothetical protein
MIGYISAIISVVVDEVHVTGDVALFGWTGASKKRIALHPYNLQEG